MVKALIILILAALVFGSAGYFAYEMFIKPEQMLQAEKRERQLNPPTPPPDPSLGDYAKLQKINQSDDLVAAREAYREFLQNWPKSVKRDEAMETLGQINTDIFFSRHPAPEKVEYVVKPGDALVKIASKLNASVEMIMMSNNLDGTLINVGDTLLVPKPDFAMVINEAEQTATLYDHGQFFKRYKAVEWNVPGKPRKPGTHAKVTSSFALLNGEQISIGSKSFFDANRWVVTTIPAITFYSVREGGTAKEDKPGTGVGLAASDMQELSALMRRGTPITFE